MAIPTTYPNGTITWDVYADDGIGGRAQFDLSETFCVLIDGQDAAVATIAGGGTEAGIASMSGGTFEYIIENWALGGTVGTGVMQAAWYVVGTGGGSVAPFPFYEYIYNILPIPTDGYCTLYDLQKYGLEGATNYFNNDDEGNAYIEQAYNWLNRRLEAVLPDVNVPVATNRAGLYDEHLIAANALMANYYLASKRHRGEYSRQPDWITDFKDDAFGILDAIGSRHVILEEQTSGVESGIGPVTVGATNTGSAVFHNDRYAYRGFYLGSDFPRTFVIEIDGTSSDNDIGDCTFKWSFDGGIQWEQTGARCATYWIHLANNAHIRWEGRGGTTDQLVYGDRWSFTCTPLSKYVAGQPKAVRSYQMRRG